VGGGLKRDSHDPEYVRNDLGAQNRYRQTVSPFEVKLLVSQNDPTMHFDLIHSPSWRVDRPVIILTWVGIAQIHDLVIDQWPNVLPVTTEMFAKVGNPITHAANEPPTPRDSDVLLHAIRHLRFLRDTNGPAGR
jgi:hypothetical protein